MPAEQQIAGNAGAYNVGASLAGDRLRSSRKPATPHIAIEEINQNADKLV